MRDNIYANGADLSMLLTDMMEWTHWATRMHPSLRMGAATASPYTADQREKIAKINETVSLNTLSRIWQVMVAAVPEMQAAGNQKQCFDMLVIRLMNIADLPSVATLLQQERQETGDKRQVIGDRRQCFVIPAKAGTGDTISLSPVSCLLSPSDLADALSKSKERTRLRRS